jgi:putative transposase
MQCFGMPKFVAPHQRNLRKFRLSRPGGLYLLTVCTEQRKHLFVNPALAAQLATRLNDPELFGSNQCLCWVVMPDHWHALIRLGLDESLSKCLQRVMAITAKELNLLRSRPGITVWQKGYYESELSNDWAVADACAYIINNPIRAGIVQSISDYPYWNVADGIDLSTLAWKPLR